MTEVSSCNSLCLWPFYTIWPNLMNLGDPNWNFFSEAPFLSKNKVWRGFIYLWSIVLLSDIKGQSCLRQGYQQSRLHRKFNNCLWIKNHHIWRNEIFSIFGLYMQSFSVIDLCTIAYVVCMNFKQSRNAFLPKKGERKFWKNYVWLTENWSWIKSRVLMPSILWNPNLDKILGNISFLQVCWVLIHTCNHFSTSHAIKSSHAIDFVDPPVQVHFKLAGYSFHVNS